MAESGVASDQHASSQPTPAPVNAPFTGSALPQHAQASNPMASAGTIESHANPSDAVAEPTEPSQPTAAVAPDASEAVAEPVAPSSPAVRVEQPAPLAASNPLVPHVQTGDTAGSEADADTACNGLCQAQDPVMAEPASVDVADAVADTAQQLSSTGLTSEALADTGANVVTDAAAADAAGTSADTLADAANADTAAATGHTAAGTADGLSTSAPLANATATDPCPQASTQLAAGLRSTLPIQPQQLTQEPPAQNLSSKDAAQKQLAACFASPPDVETVVQSTPAEILSSKEAAAHSDSALPSASAAQEKAQLRSATVFIPSPGWATTAGSSVEPGKAATRRAASGLSAPDGDAPQAAGNGSSVDQATLQKIKKKPVWHAKQRRSGRSAKLAKAGAPAAPATFLATAEVPPTAAGPPTAAASVPKGGAALKGHAIEIWWSKDKTYYPGVVKSFSQKTVSVCCTHNGDILHVLP